MIDNNQHINNQSDIDLMAEWNNPAMHQKIFESIMQKYKVRLYWHIRRILVNHDDTDDALQETFIKAWKNLDKFRQESGLYTWLYRIGTNTALTFLSKRKKMNLNHQDLDTDQMDQIVGSSTFDANKLEWKLQLAIATLPEKQRLVFNLRYFDEMPYEQISEVLDTSTGALKANYHHAAKKIQDYLLNHT